MMDMSDVSRLSPAAQKQILAKLGGQLTYFSCPPNKEGGNY